MLAAAGGWSVLRPVGRAAGAVRDRQAGGSPAGRGPHSGREPESGGPHSGVPDRDREPDSGGPQDVLPEATGPGGHPAVRLSDLGRRGRDRGSRGGGAKAGAGSDVSGHQRSPQPLSGGDG